MDERRKAFAELVAGAAPVGREQLAMGALLVGTTVDPGIDLDAEDGRLAELADSCSATSAGPLAAELFASGRFSGNQSEYYDPDNSVLPRVLDRGVGIPITLSVLFIDVGRRRGIEVDGVAMPVHFVSVADDVYYDVFNAGTALDAAGCEALYGRMTGGRGRLPTGALSAVPPAAILQRMLWNLRSIAEGRNDFPMATRVLGLLSCFPDAPLQVRVAYATTLAERGRFDLAAAELEAALEVAPESAVERLQARADQWVARLN